MAKLSGGGTLTATADTAIESTATLRGIRAHFFNPSASTRTVKVKYGAQRTDELVIPTLQSDGAGPHTLGAAETLKAWQDTGTDVEFRISGDD